jgi:fumarate reductase subunit C
MPEPSYTLYHPKWYRRHVSVWWWLESWTYTRFVLRELTSVMVAITALLNLELIYSLTQGPEAYAGFLEGSRSPLLVILNVFTLGAVLFHSITWFNLAPKALVVRLGGKRVPDWIIVAMNYFAWLVATILVAGFMLGV